MTNISWLAALLSPRSVSPHGNFRSVDLVTPAGLLGLVISGDERDRDRDQLVERLPQSLTLMEVELIEAARESTQFPTLKQGADRLARFATGLQAPDAAMQVAAGLLAATAFSELDEVEPALNLLEILADQIPTESDDDLLLAGALMQQHALRSSEAGIPFEHARNRARDLLGAVDSAKVTRYPTSQGSRWPAATTNQNMLRALKEANQNLFDSTIGFPDTRELKRLLRTPNSPLVSAMIRHAGTGKSAYVKEAFSTFTLSSERSVRLQDPVDHPIWRALFFFELVGHRQLSRAYRKLLGELRTLRAQGNAEACREGLRLIRHAGDAKELRLALGRVRAGGPLAALAQEAAAIVENRLTPVLMRDVELATLEAAAQLLDTRAADRALTAVLAALDDVPIASPFRRELAAVQVEHLFEVAAALAPVAQRASEVAARVLDSAERVGSTDDQLMVRAHASALRPIDWDEVNESVKERWRTWIVAHQPDSRAGGWDSLVNMLAPELRGDDVAEDPAPDEPSLDRVANELNIVMTRPGDSQAAAAWLREVAGDLVTERLESIRREAARGMYAGYSIEPADLAVALAQHTGADLWESVTEYLLDPQIPRRMKTEALNRISAMPDVVPPSVTTTFASRGRSLLAADASHSPFDPPAIDPYPAAVRALAALGVLSTDDLLSALAILAAGSTKSKLEASRTLSTVVATGETTPEWAVSIALQLSSDPNGNVRAEAGRTLAVSLQNTEFAHALLVARLLELLDEDGMLVPLLVLRGLAAEGDLPTGPIRKRVQDIANEHPVFGVRIQARYTLGELE